MPIDDSVNEGRWTILKALQWTVAYFKRYCLESPRVDAEILLAHALGCQRIDLYLRHDLPLNEDELTRFKNLIRRRINREPVAYIVGAKEFWSLSFAVNPSVLIPRPDTECLVETALKYLPEGGAGGACHVIELGVGSGAVIVAIAHERPTCRFWASDRSGAALVLARQNARRHGVDHLIHFFQGHWLDAVIPQGAFFDMVLSNPPYIQSSAISDLDKDIRSFEPIDALDGGPDGLREISHIIPAAHARLKPGGWLLLEIGFDQRTVVETLAQDFGGYAELQVEKDYSGHDRVVRLRKGK